MQELKTKRAIFFLGGIAAFALVLVVGVNVLLRRVEPAYIPPPPAENEPPPEENDEAEFRIQKEFLDSRPVTYTLDGFSPQTLTIQEGDSAGCMISVLNRSDSAIKVGVSPHDPAGDPGADYGEISPGNTGILDVRYSGLAEISLHNHFRPEHGFTVTYGPGCE